MNNVSIGLTTSEEGDRIQDKRERAKRTSKWNRAKDKSHRFAQYAFRTADKQKANPKMSNQDCLGLLAQVATVLECWVADDKCTAEDVGQRLSYMSREKNDDGSSIYVDIPTFGYKAGGSSKTSDDQLSAADELLDKFTVA